MGFLLSHSRHFKVVRGKRETRQVIHSRGASPSKKVGLGVSIGKGGCRVWRKRRDLLEKTSKTSHKWWIWKRESFQEDSILRDRASGKQAAAEERSKNSSAGGRHQILCKKGWLASSIWGNSPGGIGGKGMSLWGEKKTIALNHLDASFHESVGEEADKREKEKLPTQRYRDRSTAIKGILATSLKRNEISRGGKRERDHWMHGGSR